MLHTDKQVLLLERAPYPGYWQSVTGSLEAGEQPLIAVQREVAEETGIEVAMQDIVDWRVSNRFPILDQWKHRYAPGVTHNTEHVFSIELAQPSWVRIARGEHRAWQWISPQKAAALCFSWSNRDAIRMITLKQDNHHDY